MRRLLVPLVLVACLAIAVLPACGNDGESSSVGSALSYLPQDTPFAVAVDTNLDGDQYKAVDSILGRFPIDAPTVKELLREEIGGGGSRIDFERDIEPILGNPLIIGASDVTGFTGDGEPRFVGALEAPDGEALDRLIERTRPREVGEVAGATKYEDGGTFFAVDDDVAVLASNEELLDSALERAEGDDHLEEDDFNAGLEGLPGDALARVYVDLEALIGSSDARQVEWIGALRTLGLTVSAREDELEILVKARTDGGNLSEEDLPIAAGDEAPPVLEREGEIGFGIRNPARIIRFVEATAQVLDPSGFGDYAQAKQTIDARLDISIDDDLIGQLTGDLAASVAPDGGFAVRAEVRDPAALKRTLAKVADLLPRFAEGAGFGPVTIDGPDGGVYRVAQADGDDIGLGVVDDVLVVADDPSEVDEIAAEEPQSVDGAEGAVAMHADAQQLANALLEDFGPALGLSGFDAFGAQLFTDEFGDLLGSLSASTDAISGRLSVTFE